ncbi:MAG: sigma-70 family RNA polymerase sigma factor [Planctomycetota bacterium]
MGRALRRAGRGPSLDSPRPVLRAHGEVGPLAPPREDEDAALLRRFLGGEAVAMDALVERYHQPIYSFVLHYLGDPDAARDVTQEAWLKVLRGARGFRGRSKVRTWLFSIARNACLDHVRTRGRREARVETDDSLGDVPTDGPSIVDRLARAELSRRVERALRTLPPEQREVFLLREHGELTFNQIADALDVPRDTVKSRMRYALQRLHKALGAEQEVPSREL